MFSYVRQLITHLNSHIRFKIIVPYAVLTLMVAITGVYLSVRLVAQPLEERFRGELIEAGRVVANGIAQRERLHLSALRSIAFTEGLAEAITLKDDGKLNGLILPIAANAGIDRVDIIRADGHHLMGLSRPPGSNSSVGSYSRIEPAEEDTSEWPIWKPIQKALDGVVELDRDKFVALASLDGNRQHLFFTIGPVKLEGEIVGAVVVSSYTEDLLESLRQLTTAEITLYDLDGHQINTTFDSAEQGGALPAIDPRDARLLVTVEGDASRQRSASIRDQGYDMLFGVFWARGQPLGFYSVVKETTFTRSISNLRLVMSLIFAVALVLVFGIGYLTANTITGRLQSLMENAMAVAKGDYTKRTRVSSDDEIGKLSREFNYMTERLAGKIFELTVLHKSSTDMTGKSGPNLDHSLQALSSSVQEAISGVNNVVVYLLDEKERVLMPWSSVLSGPPYVFPPLAIPDNSQMRAMLEAGRPQLIGPGDLEPYAVNGSLTVNGLSKLLIAPLIAGQETIGMLTLTPDPAYPQIDLLDEDTERLLGTLANQAAISIKNDQLFEATQRAYEDLQQLDNLKTEFINIAAHELRTPLGGIILAANYIEKRGTPKLQKKAHAVTVSALRMRTMVDAMLTIQRLDAGTAFLRTAPVDVRDIIKKAINDFQPMAELEGHVITVNLPDRLPTIQADAEKVSLILSNLLSNAIKFTPQGGQIQVAARDYLKGILVSVTDSGVGIKPEDQQEIFERFHQVRPEHMAGHGGLGLGLTIVKHLVELHQGQVWVESEPGQGSTFKFTLPLEEPTQETGASPSLPDARPPNPKERLLEPT